MSTEEKLSKLKELAICYLNNETGYDFASGLASEIIMIIDDVPDTKTGDEYVKNIAEIGKKYGSFK